MEIFGHYRGHVRTAPEEAVLFQDHDEFWLIQPKLMTVIWNQ
jgi:hypothetical protein